MRKRKTARQPSKNEPAGLRLRWWHGMLFVAGVILTLFIHHWPASAPAFRSIDSLLARAHSGPLPPWGEIEYTPIYLQRPEETFSSNIASPPLNWIFENQSESQVDELLNACELPAIQKQLLLDKSRWKPAAPGWMVTPSLEVLRDLSPSARKEIYSVLRQSSRNQYQFYPFRFAPDKFDDWLAKCGLSKEIQEAFRRLTYADGNTIYFSDIPYVKRVWPREDMVSLMKAITPTPTFVMKLRITPDSDIAALEDYWGRAGRGKAMNSFLSSLAKVPDGVAISASYFFPAFARMRLYTYPDPTVDTNSFLENCSWTAMNFLNETPDNRFYDLHYTMQVIHTDYTRMETNWTFGDLIMLVDHQHRPVHISVYVADHVVFTKNGVDDLQPWVLMKMTEMRALYTTDQPLEVIAYRRKKK